MSRQLLAFDLGQKLLLNDSGSGESVSGTYLSVSHFLNLLVPNIFILAGLVFLFLLIGGGFSIIASGGNAKNVESGKNQILSAIIGFLVIFSAYWIILIVERFTGVPIFNSTL